MIRPRLDFRRIAAVFAARNREFFRDRATLAWSVVLPVAIVFGFAFAFSGSAPERYTIGVLGDPAAAERALGIDHVEYARVRDRSRGVEQVRHHELDLLIDAQERRYWVSDASPKGYMLERVLRGVNVDERAYSRESVPGRVIRYVDWLVPGLLAMNMMFTALFGVGFVIVRYRKNGVLKRFKATPLRPAEYLIAQLASRLMIIVVITSAIFVGSHAILDFPIQGNPLGLLLVLIAGGICLISLGLIVAARTASEERRSPEPVHLADDVPVRGLVLGRGAAPMAAGRRPGITAYAYHRRRACRNDRRRRPGGDRAAARAPARDGRCVPRDRRVAVPLGIGGISPASRAAAGQASRRGPDDAGELRWPARCRGWSWCMYGGWRFKSV